MLSKVREQTKQTHIHTYIHAYMQYIAYRYTDVQTDATKRNTAAFSRVLMTIYTVKSSILCVMLDICAFHRQRRESQ